MWSLFPVILFALAPARPAELFRPIGLDAALAAARAEKKCVLVACVRPASVEAKKLQTATWNEPRLREWMAAKTVPIQIDVDAAQELVDRLRVHTAPTVIFLGESGLEMDRVTGLLDGRAFLAEAKAILGGADPLERARKRLAASPNDPYRRLDVALVLVDRGDFTAALEAFAWCWDHGVEADPGFTTTRRTFLLREIVRLSRLHPAAVDEMSRRTARILERITACDVAEADLLDFLLLNRELGQEERTLAAFDGLDSASEPCAALRARLQPLVIDALVGARRYEEVAVWIGDPRERFNTTVAEFRAEAERIEREHPSDAFVRVEARRREVCKQAARHHEALLGAKRYDAGERLSKLVLYFDARGSTYLSLIRGALRAEAHAQAKALTTQALADPKLTPTEKDEVRTLARAIVQPR